MNESAREGQDRAQGKRAFSAAASALNGRVVARDPADATSRVRVYRLHDDHPGAIAYWRERGRSGWGNRSARRHGYLGLGESSPVLTLDHRIYGPRRIVGACFECDAPLTIRADVDLDKVECGACGELAAHNCKLCGRAQIADCRACAEIEAERERLDREGDGPEWDKYEADERAEVRL